MYNIPKKILIILQKLEDADFEAFLVGGSVRDLLRGKKPKDWDITTSAKPEEILKIFPDGKYENQFGTVILPAKYITSVNLGIYKGINSSKQNLKILSKKINLDKQTKERLIAIAKKYLHKIQCPAHGIKYAEDVVKTAQKISKNYKEINSNLIEVLGWFYDTGHTINPPKEYIKNSKKIIKKEFQTYFKDDEVDKISQAIEHNITKESIFLEQQILKEADVIEGLNIERINSYKTDQEIKKHIEWIKNKFRNDSYYLKFKTLTGKRLLEVAINKFNKESFSIDVKIPNWDKIDNIEITTYRIESTYSDNRRPNKVKFAKTLEEDLKRRDFTCNAIALSVSAKEVVLRGGVERNEVEQGDKRSVISRSADKKYKPNYEIIDLFNGQQDIKNQVIRAVGDANERFNEDALRMMRAVRLATQLSTGEDLQFLKDRKGEGNQNQKTGYQSTVVSSQRPKAELLEQSVSEAKSLTFRSREKKENKSITNNQTLNQRWWIGENTLKALKKNSHLLKHISPERISDELQKIILSNRPAWGIELLVETSLMKYIIPEIYDTIGVRQNRHHYYGPYNTVYKHMLAALKTCPSDKLEVRLAAFFHDIGKPKAKRGHGYKSTFYGHEYIGAQMTKVIMKRLKFPKKITDKTVLLVKNHMFYYNVDEVGEKGVRKVIRKVGLENINDLIDVRIGDRLGSGVSKAVPYKLRHFKYMVEKVSNDPISVKDLKINGDILLAEYNFKPGPQMGAILEILLAEVLDDPKLNTIEHLAKRALELQKENLQDLRKLAKQKIKEEKQEEEEETKGKYWVK